MSDELTTLVQKINVMLRMLKEESTQYAPIEPRGMPKNIDREVCKGKIQILTHVLDLFQENSFRKKNSS